MARGLIHHACVFGLGWGDEGKGKVVDLLCPAFDAVVRYNGGANAGHTVCVGAEKFAMHLLPAGVLHGHMTAIIGPGVVVDPNMLLSEIDGLTQRGMDVADRVKVSERAHLVLPYHKLEDQLAEQAAGVGGRIGTTARGIGPCYADKMRRSTAVRFADLVGEIGLDDRVRRVVAGRSASLRAMFNGDGGLDVEGVLGDLRVAKERLASNVCDTTALLRDHAASGRAILFEGANGILLDVDHGTFPFVTSSSTGPNGIASGAGVPPSLPMAVIGVAKAYSTRVGSGPFVTELKDAVGNRIRERGHEYGTTTGRPRRCGWFDAVACRYAAELGGVTDVALLHLDTLTGFEEIGICTAYRIAGRTVRSLLASAAELEGAEPVVEFVPGWTEELGSVREFGDLPGNTRRLVERIESLVGAPVSILGVGPERSQVVVRGGAARLVDAGTARRGVGAGS